MQTYTRQPIALVRGKGSLVFDIEGRKYIDCVAGIAVNNVGHCHPAVVESIKNQAEQLIHVSNLYYTSPQAMLAEKLVSITGMDRIFFCNSGTEAVEAAMKLARTRTGRQNFVSTYGAFHGRSMGALSLTHKEAYRNPFRPLVENVDFVPYNDIKAVSESVDQDTAAVIIEPIQGEAGVNVPSPGYLQEVRRICDENDALLIFDEVQTGFGRTGTWFCRQHSGVLPDIMTMAKAMGGGFPMGAIASREDISFGKGEHASTFGGNPLACAASLAAIGAIEDENMLERCTRLGEYFMSRLKGMSRDDILDVRGAGLMIGVELGADCGDIVSYGRENGVLLNCTSDSVLRLVPPFVITEEQIDTVVDTIEQA
nr:acetylornithine transaminase [Methanosalsum zhilinae]